MYAFSLDDLKVVVLAINDYYKNNNLKAFDNLNPIQIILLEEIKKIFI